MHTFQSFQSSDVYVQARDVGMTIAERTFFYNVKRVSPGDRNLFNKGFVYGFDAAFEFFKKTRATPTSAPPPAPTSKYDNDPEWS